MAAFDILLALKNNNWLSAPLPQQGWLHHEFIIF
jgi:hypothetical protein